MVQFGFYAWTGVALSMLVAVLKNSAQPWQTLKYYLLFIVLWLAYIIALVFTGVLNDFGLPPRLPLLVVIPAVLMGIILSGRASFKYILLHTPLHLPVLLQSFRIIVELLIYGAFREGVLPQRTTFEGLNYDIVVGISALGMGGALYAGKLNTKFLLFWNIISLSILSLTVYSFVSSFYGTVEGWTRNSDFIEFPYILLPAVLLPIAIFLHIFSIRQAVSLERKKQ